MATPRCYLDPDTLEPNTGQNGLCYGTSGGTFRPPVVVSSPTPLAAWIPSVALYDVSTASVVSAVSQPCVGCDPLEWQVPPGATRAVVVGVASIPEFRPDLPGPYSDIDDKTGVADPGGGTARECLAWTPGGTSSNPWQQCSRVQNFDPWRVVTRAGLTTGALQVDWSSAAGPALSSRSNWMLLYDSDRRIQNFSWTTSEL